MLTINNFKVQTRSIKTRGPTGDHPSRLLQLNRWRTGRLTAALDLRGLRERALRRIVLVGSFPQSSDHARMAFEKVVYYVPATRTSHDDHHKFTGIRQTSVYRELTKKISAFSRSICIIPCNQIEAIPQDRYALNRHLIGKKIAPS